MPPNDKDKAYLWDMLKFSKRAALLAEHTDFHTYKQDWTAQMSIERALEIVGEAARRVSAECKEEYRQIPWREIIGQRNVLAHEYGEIQNELIWKSATRDSLELIEMIKLIIPDIDDEDVNS